MLHKIKSMIPKKVKNVLRPLHNIFANKYTSELSYWKFKHKKENGKFSNSHYKKIMLAMAQETDDDFLKNKIVGDFGCGPRGSLFWANPAHIRIGIDVLVDCYTNAFKQDLLSHNMLYIKSTEDCIPIPDNFLDIIFSLNAIDHVDSFPIICDEITRILKKGGIFYCSLNLEEPKSITEPQVLTEKIIETHLLSKMKVLEYRVTNKGPENNLYKPFYDNSLIYTKGTEGFLWIKLEKI